jgi:hypothetical protein
VNDQWVPGPPPAPPQWVNPLPSSNDWGNAPGCSAPAGPSVVQGIVITGVPATISSLYWQIVLNDGASPPNYLINHLDGQGNVIGAPMLISGVDASITFNDPVYLSEDPVQPMQAATKQYVDDHAGAGGIGEAPMDNYTYARYMATWERLPQAYIPEAPNTGQRFGRFNSTWQLDAIQTDAPSDGGTYGRQNGAWNPALALTGGTITGSLTVNQVLTVQGPNSLVLNAPINQQRSIMSMTSNIARWLLTLGDGTSEDASNHGANFSLSGYGITGAFLGNWLTIARADGSTVFGGGVTMNQGLSVNSLFALQGPGMFYLPGGTAGQMLATDGDGLLSWQTPPGAGGPFLPLIGGTLTGALNLNPPVSGIRYISGQTAGSLRWLINVGDSSAESGANAGSNFSLQSFTDAGAALGTPLSINRATGKVAFNLQAGAGNPNFPHIDGPAGISRQIAGSTSGGDRWGIALGNSVPESGGNAGSDLAIARFDDAGAYIDDPLYISRATGVPTFSQPIVNGSDRRLKSEVEPVANALDIIAQLEGVYYRLESQARRQVGLVAQDVIGSLPEVVFETGVPGDALVAESGDASPMLGISYPNIVAVLINAVKELKAEIDTLREEAGLG